MVRSPLAALLLLLLALALTAGAQQGERDLQQAAQASPVVQAQQQQPAPQQAAPQGPRKSNVIPSAGEAELLNGNGDVQPEGARA